MITCRSQKNHFATVFSNGRHEAVGDVPAAKGGGDAGFRPHELLEAALACCLNISLRMYAASHNIPLVSATARVNLDRQVAGEAAFEYGLELHGPITEAQRQELLQAAEACAVHQTLMSKISFKRLAE